jgi:hypothetical protein
MALRGKKENKPNKPTGTPKQKPKGQYMTKKPKGQYMTKKPVSTWAVDSKMNRDNYPHSKAMKRKGYG